MSRVIIRRTRYFVAVEGDGEQAFVRWLQQLADEAGLSIHLDCKPLNGGGYKTMLERAIEYRLRKERRRAKASILIVDADRAENNDWSIERLREEATKNNFQLILQTPNQEGLLLRMIPGNEQLRPYGPTTLRQLTNAWNTYKKPVTARMLSRRFDVSNLRHAAEADSELRVLLGIIGLL